MADINLTHDGTVSFLPHRLNRQPVVVRGLTADELWITVGLGGVAGLFLGIPVAILLGQFALVPTTILICIALGVLIGGSMLRRRKRGRPETWLYRQIQWQIRLRYPFLAAYTGGNALITRTGYWVTKRSIR